MLRDILTNPTMNKSTKCCEKCEQIIYTEVPTMTPISEGEPKKGSVTIAEPICRISNCSCHHPPQKDDFSDFMHNATDEEKKELLTRVAKRATQDQIDLIAQKESWIDVCVNSWISTDEYGGELLDEEDILNMKMALSKQYQSLLTQYKDKLRAEYTNKIPSDRNLAGWLHDNYEEIAFKYDWKTQESTRVPFDELPQQNRLTMLELARRFNEKLLSLINEE